MSLSGLGRSAILCPTFGRSVRDPGALAQCGAQVDRPAVFFQDIGEGFIGQFLKRHHAVARQQIERRPALLVQLHALAGHCGVSLALFLFWNLLAFFARFGETDGDGLLAAFHLAALTAFAALGGAALIAVHFAFDVAAGARRIFSLAFLGHVISSKPSFSQSATRRRMWRRAASRNGRILMSVRRSNNRCDRNRLPAR